MMEITITKEVILSYLQSKQEYKNIKNVKAIVIANQSNVYPMIYQAINQTLIDNRTDPMQKLLAVRFAKDVLELQNKELSKLFGQHSIQYYHAIAIYKKEDKDPDRGRTYFSQSPDKITSQIGNSLLRMVLESIAVWAKWFPTDINDQNQEVPSPYLQMYHKLIQEGVTFPDFQYFKEDQISANESQLFQSTLINLQTHSLQALQQQKVQVQTSIPQSLIYQQQLIHQNLDANPQQSQIHQNVEISPQQSQVHQNLGITPQANQFDEVLINKIVGKIKIIKEDLAQICCKNLSSGPTPNSQLRHIRDNINQIQKQLDALINERLDNEDEETAGLLLEDQELFNLLEMDIIQLDNKEMSWKIFRLKYIQDKHDGDHAHNLALQKEDERKQNEIESLRQMEQQFHNQKQDQHNLHLQELLNQRQLQDLNYNLQELQNQKLHEQINQQIKDEQKKSYNLQQQLTQQNKQIVNKKFGAMSKGHSIPQRNLGDFQNASDAYQDGHESNQNQLDPQSYSNLHEHIIDLRKQLDSKDLIIAQIQLEYQEQIRQIQSSKSQGDFDEKEKFIQRISDLEIILDQKDEHIQQINYATQNHQEQIDQYSQQLQNHVINKNQLDQDHENLKQQMSENKIHHNLLQNQMENQHLDNLKTLNKQSEDKYFRSEQEKQRLNEELDHHRVMFGHHQNELQDHISQKEDLFNDLNNHKQNLSLKQKELEQYQQQYQQFTSKEMNKSTSLLIELKEHQNNKQELETAIQEANNKHSLVLSEVDQIQKRYLMQKENFHQQVCDTKRDFQKSYALTHQLKSELVEQEDVIRQLQIDQTEFENERKIMKQLNDSQQGQIIKLMEQITKRNQTNPMDERNQSLIQHVNILQNQLTVDRMQNQEKIEQIEYQNQIMIDLVYNENEQLKYQIRQANLQTQNLHEHLDRLSQELQNQDSQNQDLEQHLKASKKKLNYIKEDEQIYQMNQEIDQLHKQLGNMINMNVRNQNMENKQSLSSKQQPKQSEVTINHSQPQPQPKPQPKPLGKTKIIHTLSSAMLAKKIGMNAVISK